MGKVYLVPGEKFLFNGRAYQIIEEKEPDVFLVRDLEFNSAEITFTRKDIITHLQNGNLYFSESGKNTSDDLIRKYNFQDTSMLPEKLQEEMKFRWYAIKPLVNLNVESINPYVKARVEELKKEGHSVSRASLYRWIKAYMESNEDIRSLVSSYKNCGPKNTRLEKEVEMIMDQVIDKYYLSKEATTIQTVYELIYHQIEQENKFREPENKLKQPSISTIRRRIQARDQYEVAKARKGVKYARDKFGQVTLQEKPKYPLQRVEADHTKLDLFVVDDETRLPIGRPFITSLIDVFTGYPLGVYIGFEPPSYTSVMHALNHAIFPKYYLKEKYPKIKNEWFAYGMPEVLVVDNGKEFLSKHLADACMELQIELVHNPVKMPWYKGAIERHFRTINQQLIHQTKGTTFSNIIDKGEYDPMKNAVIGFNELLEIFHKWLVDYYAIKPNKGVNGVPAELWKKSFENIPEPAVPASNIDWKILLMKMGSGSIQRTGIRYMYLHYQSPKLRTLQHELLKRGKKNMVKFKYDPTDLSKIYVYDEFNHRYFEVLCTDQEYSRGLNEYAHRVIKKKAYEEAKRVDMSALAAAKAEIMEMISEIRNLTIKERRKAERIKGTGSDKVFNNIPKEKNEEPVLEVEKVKNKKVVPLFDDIDYENDWGVLDGIK
jgi:putative transposase